MGLKRKLGIASAALAILLVLYGGLTRTWWSSPDEAFRSGPPGIESCGKGPCRTQGWDGLDGGDAAWRRWIVLARVTYWGALLTGAALLVALVLGALRTAIHLVAPGLVAAVASFAFLLVAALYFGFTPARASEYARLGAGFWAALIGAALGVVGGVLLAARPVRRPFET